MSGLQTTIWNIRKLLTLGTVKMAQLALPAFLGSVRGTGCRPRRSKSNHKTGPFAANAAFCRLIFLQLPSSQLDMAEACGSRINNHKPEVQWFDGVAPHTLRL